MTAAEVPLFIYVAGSLFLWAAAALPMKRSRRELATDRVAKKLQGKNRRGVENFSDLIPQALDRLARWARSYAFLSANLVATAVVFLYAVALNESTGGGGLDGYGWSSVYVMFVASLSVTLLLVRRYLVGEQRPFRNLQRYQQIWLGAATVTALLAFLVLANRPI